MIFECIITINNRIKPSQDGLDLRNIELVVLLLHQLLHRVAQGDVAQRLHDSKLPEAPAYLRFQSSYLVQRHQLEEVDELHEMRPESESVQSQISCPDAEHDVDGEQDWLCEFVTFEPLVAADDEKVQRVYHLDVDIAEQSALLKAFYIYCTLELTPAVPQKLLPMLQNAAHCLLQIDVNGHVPIQGLNAERSTLRMQCSA